MSSAGRIGGMLMAVLCCLPLLLVAGESANTPAEPAPRVANLFYGDALFHYYQNDPFGAIIRILAYDSQDRLGSDRPEARLLLAGTRLTWGQTAAAEADFRRLLETHASDGIRNRAWFQLARIAYARDEFPRVLQSLAHIDDGWGTSEQQGERRLLKALTLLKSGKLEPARETLARHGGASLMQHYLSYNLGVLLARSGRLEEAVRAWDEAAFETPRDAEQAALDDLVNSVAGHALLRAGRDRAAATRLARVRLQGPYSDKALLGYGLALFRQGRLEEAIGVWQALEARERVSPAILEARLAIPHALARLGALGQAAEAYQAAIAHFDQRQRQLVALLQQTDQDAELRGLLKALAEGRGQEGERAYAPWLYDLFAGNLFQETLRNYRDLQVLRQQLLRWQDAVGPFRLMLAERRARFESVLPRLQAFRHRAETDPFRAQLSALQDELDRARHEDDGTAFADAETRRRLQRLASIRTRIAGLPEGPQRDALARKARVLDGLIHWELQQALPQRAWSVEKSLRQVHDDLRTLEHGLAGVDDLVKRARAGFEGFARRIDSVEQRIPAQLRAVESLLEAHEQVLRREMQHRLRARLQRLALYRTQARYALARLHDKAVSETDDTPASLREEAR